MSGQSEPSTNPSIKTEAYFGKISEIIESPQLKSYYRNIVRDVQAKRNFTKGPISARICERCLLGPGETTFKYYLKSSKPRKRPRNKLMKMLLTCQTCEHVMTYHIPNTLQKPISPQANSAAAPVESSDSKRPKRKAKSSEFSGLKVNVVKNVWAELGQNNHEVIMLEDEEEPPRKRPRIERNNSVIEIIDSNDEAPDDVSKKVSKKMRKLQKKTKPNVVTKQKKKKQEEVTQKVSKKRRKAQKKQKQQEVTQKLSRKMRKLQKKTGVDLGTEQREQVVEEVTGKISKKKRSKERKAKVQLENTESLVQMAKKLKSIKKAFLQSKKEKKRLKHKLKTTQDRIKNIETRKKNSKNSLKTFLDSIQ